MRIFIHDRPGHPFQVQLSRELAGRGHQVLYSYGSFFQTPNSPPTKRAGDPESFQIEAIGMDRPFEKYSLVRRRFQEIAYGRRLSAQIKDFGPEAAVFTNMPPDAQWVAYRECGRPGVRLIYWLQDLYGIAIDRIFKKRVPLLGSLIGRYYIGLERKMLAQSDAVVLITDDFQPLMRQWRIDSGKTHVIPNWAPLEELPVRPRQNHLARELGVADKFCFLYSGTLGIKHDPEPLLQLAIHFSGNEEVVILVISEGPGADWLKGRKQERGLHNLRLVHYQTYERFPDVLGSADVLVAMVRPDAGSFSVPSKVLSYLCARRPLLLAVPEENLAARIVSQNRAGLVVAAADVMGFIKAADRLAGSPSLREELATNGRAYAERQFDIERICDEFEGIIVR